eukprot:363329-Chlamydomonas_euryale.AAC.2
MRVARSLLQPDTASTTPVPQTAAAGGIDPQNDLMCILCVCVRTRWCVLGLEQIIRAREPQGVLMYGPPGTGKTLLARAVANRTDACFIRVIGSELVQKYVGEGARMVRELFQMARSKKACIIFFDEVRAVLARANSKPKVFFRHVECLSHCWHLLEGFCGKGRCDDLILVLAGRQRMCAPSMRRFDSRLGWQAAHMRSQHATI